MAGEQIQLEGALNFRELGGYITKDGRKVKKGLFIRGGKLSSLTLSDLEIIQSYHIKHILDFRSKVESSIDPDPSLEGVVYENMSPMLYSDGSEVDFSPEGIEKLQRVFQKGDHNGFVELNISIFFHNPVYQHLFDLMSNQQVPILYHCTAGKDRTGVASVLILLALGCDEETVIKDYLLTNKYREPFILDYASKHQEELNNGTLTMESIRTREGVSENTLRLSLERIKEQYSSYDEFLMNEYRMDLNKLRELYLED